jgi:hypothetical protein
MSGSTLTVSPSVVVEGEEDQGAVIVPVQNVEAMRQQAQKSFNAPSAERAPSVKVDPDGQFSIENGAFSINSGKDPNQSQIPATGTPIEQTSLQEGKRQTEAQGTLAPRSVELSISPMRVQEGLQNVLPGATIDPSSLRSQADFELKTATGKADYAQRLTAFVVDKDGNKKGEPIVLTTRGDKVTSDGSPSPLPTAAKGSLEFGATDKVVVVAQNIRENGGKPFDSGIFVVTDEGKFVRLSVEDLKKGGDFDLNDALTNNGFQALGRAVITRTTQEKIEEPFSQVTDKPTEQVATSSSTKARVESTQYQTQTVETTRGRLAPTDIELERLTFAQGVRVNGNGILAGVQKFRPGSTIEVTTDQKIKASFQTRPRSDTPGLFTTTVTAKPTAAPGEPLLQITAGGTKYLNPTHRTVTDASGAPARDPNNPKDVLRVPTGIGGDPTRVRGYVPSVPEKVTPGVALTPVNGIITIPQGQGAVIQPPKVGEVGRGNSWYENNVGGYLAVSPDGSKTTFHPQWNKGGFEKKPISFAPDEVSKVIYALVPQQPGLNLEIGKTYSVTPTSNGYEISDPKGGSKPFKIIAADKLPENFTPETSTIFAVEDTFPKNLGINNAFGLVQSAHRQIPGGPLISTKDNQNPQGADARVAVNAATPPTVIPAVSGQDPYLSPKTSVGAFFVSAGISTKIGFVPVETQGTTSNFQTTNTYQDSIESTEITLGVDRTTTPGVTSKTSTTNSTEQVKFAVNNKGELTDVKTSPISSSTIVTSASALKPQDGTTTFIATGPSTTTDKVISSELTSLTTELISQDVTTKKSQALAIAPGTARGELGYVHNIGGNTPWTDAANTISAGIYGQTVVIGSPDSRQGEAGFFLKGLVNLGPEERAQAFRYNEGTKTMEPLYKTKPVLGQDGNPLRERISLKNGTVRDVYIEEFERDPKGNLIPLELGTGNAKGPALTFHVEQPFNGGLRFKGGLQFNIGNQKN